MSQTTSEPAAPADNPMMPPEKFQKRLAQFIQVRDMISEMAARHKQELEPLQKALQQLNTAFLGHLHGAGVDSVKLKGVGTVYKRVSRAATVADAAELKRHVIGTQAWDLVDWRANAPAIAEYIAQHGEMPPGINYTETVVVGVRRDDKAA